jgi:hypothetical protein
MGEIQIIEAMDKNGVALVVCAVFLGLAIWLIKHYVNQQTEDRKVFVKQQEEDRATIMGLFQNELKDLHKDSSINTKLNYKSIAMLKTLTNRFTSLTEYLNLHFNGCVDKVNFKKRVSKKNGQKK